MSNIVIYQKDDGSTSLDVQFDRDTVWLNLNQMVELLGRDKSVVSRHINNVFREGELERSSVVAKIATTAADGKSYQVDHFNLDVIISVGYRVKSQRGTQFRQWATRVLREHLVNGYTLNEQRLKEEKNKLHEMQRAIDLLSRTLTNKVLVDSLGEDVLQVITDYAYALTTLDRYDHGSLVVEETSGSASFVLGYAEAISIVQSMKNDFDGLFGQEKDQGFKSALGAIYQTFDGKDVYPISKKKPPTCFTSLLKITPFPMATSASPPLSSSSLWREMKSCIVMTVPSVWPITPWSH